MAFLAPFVLPALGIGLGVSQAEKQRKAASQARGAAANANLAQQNLLREQFNDPLNVRSRQLGVQNQELQLEEAKRRSDLNSYFGQVSRTNLPILQRYASGSGLTESDRFGLLDATRELGGSLLSQGLTGRFNTGLADRATRLAANRTDSRLNTAGFLSKVGASPFSLPQFGNVSQGNELLSPLSQAIGNQGLIQGQQTSQPFSNFFGNIANSLYAAGGGTQGLINNIGKLLNLGSGGKGISSSDINIPGNVGLEGVNTDFFPSFDLSSF